MSGVDIQTGMYIVSISCCGRLSDEHLLEISFSNVCLQLQLQCATFCSKQKTYRSTQFLAKFSSKYSDSIMSQISIQDKKEGIKRT